jgi:hypothetical protein
LHFPSRRPSLSLIIATLALFISLGGVGYAAITIPNNSVGTAQLKNNSVKGSKIPQLAVGFRKIQFGAVGVKRVNVNQVQLRVSGTCAGNSAVSAVDNQGNVTCSPTSPKEFGTTGSAASVTGTATSVASKALPAGSSYMVFANPTVTVSKTTAGSLVEVDCTLSVTPGDASTTQTRSATFAANTHDNQSGSIPLMIPAPAVANGSTAAVSCTQSSTPTGGTQTVSATAAINAIQTASNS